MKRQPIALFLVIVIVASAFTAVSLTVRTTAVDAPTASGASGAQYPHLSSDLSWAMPSTGTVKMLVLLVDFSDFQHGPNQTVADVQNKMFGSGDPAQYPRESLSNWYTRSSYGQLTITGDVMDWYRASHPRSYYDTAGGPDQLMKEVVMHAASTRDLAQYDSDHNGNVDAVSVKWTGPETPVFHSACTHPNITVKSGLVANNVIWSFYYDCVPDSVPGGQYWTNTGLYEPWCEIHETGHALGLPDLYGPTNGVGGMDQMDLTWGDFNCFFKLCLGWVQPTTIGSDSMKQRIDLRPSGAYGDCVLMIPASSSNTPASEFFMVEHRKPGVGNDPGSGAYRSPPLPADGLIIWHVDAAFTSSGGFVHGSGCHDTHKLIRLMEADGLEEITTILNANCSPIKNGSSANAGDFYTPGKAFGPSTTPNSANYAGLNTHISVSDIRTETLDEMSAVFAVGPNVGDPTILTSLSAIVAPTAVVPNQGFSISGRLTNVKGGTPTDGIGGATISLQERINGSWTTVAGKRAITNTAGDYSISMSLPSVGNREYRTVYDGNSTNYGTSSTSVTVAVQTWATYLLNPSAQPWHPRIGTTAYINGTLYGFKYRTGVPNALIYLQTNASGSWTNVSSQHTISNGSYSLTVSSTIAGGRYYRTVYYGNDTYLGNTSESAYVEWLSDAPILYIWYEQPIGEWGTQFNFTGWLKQSDGHEIAGATIQLQENVSGTWTNITGKTAVTNATGSYRFTQLTENDTQLHLFRAVYAGNVTWKQVTSGILNIEMDGARTTLTGKAAPASVPVGQSFFVNGTLARTMFGTPVAGAKIYLLENVSGNFTRAWNTTTTATGAYHFELTTNASMVGTHHYVTFFSGITAGTKTVYYRAQNESISATVTAKTPTILNATAPATAFTNTNFTLTGRLTQGGAGLGSKTIALQRSTDNKTFSTLTTRTTSGTGWYQFSRNETTSGTYYYRTTYAGNATLMNATSNVVKVTIQSVSAPLSVTMIDPANNTVNVPVTKIINVTFNKTIQQGANYTNITLKKGTVKVNTTTTIVGKILSIKPNGTLTFNTTYTVLIPKAGVKNSTTTLSSDFTSRFTTVAAPKRSTILNATAPATAFTNTNFTLTGRLTQGGAGLGSKTIALQRSTDNKTFSTLTTKTTTGTGWYQFSRNETTSGTYYYRTTYAGNATLMNATSNVVKVTIKRPTALTAAVTPAHPAVNQTWTLSGQLTTGASGLANQIIKLEWSTDNVTWRSSTATNTTNTTGGYRFLLSTPSAGTYYERAAYAGTSVYASAASKGVKVVVS